MLKVSLKLIIFSAFGVLMLLLGNLILQIFKKLASSCKILLQ